MTATPRLRRLFAADGRCFDVAVDHGFFGEAAFLPGIEDMRAVVKTLVVAAPDAIQLSVGQARLLQELPRPKPALVLRTDAANVYGPNLPDLLYTEIIEDAVEQAVRLDAACVVVNLFMLPGETELQRRCIRNIMDLRPRCTQAGMPMMVEPLVMRRDATAGGYAVDGDLTKILPLVRQAVELGADVIKADPTDDTSHYHQIVDIAGDVPVLARGGGRAPIDEILARTHALMQQGVAGIVYGRNVIQHADPAGMTRALMAIVHDEATPDAVRGWIDA
ncbi:MAG: aldolase [Chloroflexota bacterium]